MSVCSSTSVILDYAKCIEANLICLGTHSHSPLYDLMVGSITEGVLEHTDIPVLAIPLP